MCKHWFAIFTAFHRLFLLLGIVFFLTFCFVVIIEILNDQIDLFYFYFIMNSCLSIPVLKYAFAGVNQGFGVP